MPPVPLLHVLRPDRDRRTRRSARLVDMGAGLAGRHGLLRRRRRRDRRPARNTSSPTPPTPGPTFRCGRPCGRCRKLHPDEIRLVLPAPGDPRGLPGPGPFTGAALEAGEGVIAGRLGLVPQVRTHTSGSGDTFEIVVWQAYPAAGAGGWRSASRARPRPRPTCPAALAEATAALTRLDVAAWRPELAGALAALRKPDNGTDLPPGYTPAGPPAVRPRQRAGPGARAGRRGGPGRRRQRFRGAAPGRGAASVD